MEGSEQRKASAVRPGWDVVIDPDDEFRYRVFTVTDEQLHGFVHALVLNGVEDFRVVRQPGTGRGPYDDDPLGGPWPDAGDDYIPV